MPDLEDLTRYWKPDPNRNVQSLVDKNGNYNSYQDILEFKNNIRHVHLKDKNFFNKNVIIGKGKVDFESIFVALKKIKYKGSFTIESQRGKNIEFQATKNYNFFKELIKKYI